LKTFAHLLSFWHEGDKKMSQVLVEETWELEDLIENLVTENDEPVDNFISEKQQRLLTETLYSSWKPSQAEESSDAPRQFLTAANVGVFFSVHAPPLVPDVFISLDVSAPADLHAKSGRSYLVWEFGKVPDVTVEIVSNRKGGELDHKLRDYARIGVKYYVVFDPMRQLSDDVLRVYEPGLASRYFLRQDYNLPNMELSLTLWQGKFENTEAEWLRWCDKDGEMLPTPDEKTEKAENRALEAEKRAELLEAELSKLGVNPKQF